MRTVMPGRGDLFKTSDDVTCPDLSWGNHPSDTVTVEINAENLECLWGKG